MLAASLHLPGVSEEAMLDQLTLLSPNMGNKVTTALKLALRCVGTARCVFFRCSGSIDRGPRSSVYRPRARYKPMGKRSSSPRAT